jgi:IS4 transposase
MGRGWKRIKKIPRQSFTRQVFFRWIKQNLNVPTLFGTSENAVYGQLYCALIVYVLLKWLFDKTSPFITSEFALSFIRFVRLLSVNNLPIEWRVKIGLVLQGKRLADTKFP